MTDIRDLILDNNDEDMNKNAEQQSNTIDSSEYIKLAEQLEALSEDDTLAVDLIKVAIYQDYMKHVSRDKESTK